ncbi:MAG: DUF262 domain-containing HNH endonuclease family protein [Caldilineaceae bacterium]|nr:DUF262 domain-containing HNH endonuclease family protein [Caldilineaceae bacterium]
MFDTRIVYDIPNYQRTYVWNLDDQWEPLWLDVIGIANPSSNDGAQYDPAPHKPHFLGATVLKEVTVRVEDAKRYIVVDGQQRITTIQLLLTAVADTFREYKELSSLEDLARGSTINWVRGKPSKSEPDKIHPLAGDFRSFTDIMKASRADGQVSEVSGPIGDCYRFFRHMAAQWLIEGADSGVPIEDRAHALLTAIFDKLQVVAIYLDADENESAIFEALNARGEPLSEWEKVKNYILFKAGEIPSIDQGQLYEQHLLAFDNRQWLEETGRGAARRRMSDQFLDYWLESKVQRPVNTRRVFREFRTELDRRAGDIDLEEWCAELKIDGEFFLKWQTTQEWDGDLETIFHSRRRAIDIGAIWPLLLALSRTVMTPEDRRRCIGALDSFLWRRNIVGRQGRNYDTITMELLNVLPKESRGGLSFSNAIIDQLDKYERVGSYWPRDDEVRHKVLERNLSSPAVRQVLEAVERGMMRGRRPGNNIMSGSLPIEHLMPQTRSVEDWPLQANSDEDAEVTRDDIIHRLGNLTLVEHGLNSKLSNRPWVQKRSILQEEDNLYINKELLNHAPSSHWDEDQIRLRGERLADYIIKIWPRGHDVTGEIELLKP